MNEQDKQSLSAILDGDLEKTLQGISGDFLKKVSHDETLRETAEHYQMIGEAMRGNHVMLGHHLSLVDDIRQKIQAEPPILAPKGQVLQFPQWFKPSIGGAIAASLLLFSINSFYTPSVNQPEMLLGNTSPTTMQPTLVSLQKYPQETVPIKMAADKTTEEPSQQDHWITNNKVLESRLNRYLIQHSENASHAGMNSVLPYTTFISYDSQ